MKCMLLPLALAAATAATPAMADFYQAFDITYSGASWGNTAVANGLIYLDLATLGTSPSADNDVTASVPPYTSISGYVSSLDLTVSGSTSGGNGAFTLADYSGIVFNFNSVDLTTQVVDQPGLEDFNFFSVDSAPSAVFPLTMLDSGGDLLSLTSLVEPSPEPSQMVSGLAMAALGGASLLVRRFRNRK